MSRATPPFLLLVLTVLPAAAAGGPIWGYQNPANTAVLSDGEAAGLTFPNTAWTDAPASGHITAALVQSWSGAPAAKPDRVNGEFYRFGLEVKDYASGATGTAEFGGVLAGDLWKDGTSLTNTFAGPTAQTLELGMNRYTVALDAFEPPTGFGEERAGRITADVAISPLEGAAPPDPAPGDVETTGAQTPEPATVVLAGMAVLGGAVAARFRRRSQQPDDTFR